MTEDPRTIQVTASIHAAADVLSMLDVRHLPVVDEEGDLVGMLSDRDLGGFLKVAVPPSRTVGDVMSGNVVSVEVDTDLEEVIETLLEQRIGAVPVLDGEGEVVGIISYVDVLRTYAGELGGSASSDGAPSRVAKKATPAKKPLSAKKVLSGKKPLSAKKGAKRKPAR